VNLGDSRPATPLRRPSLPLAEFLEEFLGRAALAGEVLLAALSDVLADLRVPKLKVVLELMNVHDTGDGDAVLFEDDVLLVQVNSFDQGTKIDAGLRDRESLDRRW